MMADADDHGLLQSYVLDGSEAAFAELVRRHQTMMRATAYRVCGDSEEAMDAMQRALIAFARRAKEIRADAGVGPWLHRAATLEAMALRRQRIKRKIREHEAMENQPQPSGGMPPEVATELDGVINKLLPKDRDVIVLHYFQGLTFRAIAGKLGGSEVAWQKRGVRALSKLSAALKRRGVVTSASALGTWMIATPVEAGVLGAALGPMIIKALRSPLTPGIPLKGGPALYLIMKMKTALAACFIAGAVLSYSLDEHNMRSLPKGQTGVLVSANRPPRAERSERQAPRFSIKAMTAAIRYFDSLEQDDPAAESQLRALMFSVPEGYLNEVLGILGEVKNIGRFQPVAAAFYARWAEIDPEAAWLAIAEAGSFTDSARRGVLLTWLNTEPEAALGRMLEKREDSDLRILAEFIDKKAQHAPRDAAMLVDHLAESWPKANRRLFPEVARAWGLADPDEAGPWIESHWDPEARNVILKQLAWRVASSSGRKGLALSDRIDDPELRSVSRNGAARWWGISSGGVSFSEKSHPDVNLSAGFPADWGKDEISSFSQGLMANNARKYPDLVSIAKDVKQRQAIYEGVIAGAGFSQPSQVIDAVENVDPAFATTEAGMKALSSYILRWNEADAAAAGAWLSSQPANEKTRLMQQAISEHTND